MTAAANPQARSLFRTSDRGCVLKSPGHEFDIFNWRRLCAHSRQVRR